jgi:hypothetical protein
MTSPEAIEQLRPVFPPLRESWQRAWADLTGKYNNPEHDNRCRSTILQMHAVIHAKRLTAEFLDYTPIETRHLFVLPDVAVFRLKKLDQQHLSRNYPTETSNKIYRQQGLPGLDDLPWFTVGIVPNEDWVDYAGIFIAYPKWSGANNWVIDITGEPHDIDELQTTFHEDFEATDGESRRFKPKRTDQQRRTDAGSAGI